MCFFCWLFVKCERERRATRTDFQAINEDLTEERMKPQKLE